MMTKDNPNESIQHFNQIYIPNDNNEIINECIKFILKYFDSFKIQDIQIYTDIFNVLLNTIKSLKDNSICLDILYWIIEKEDINKYTKRE